MADNFEISRVSANPARFDIKKCTAINADWIRKLSVEELTSRMEKQLIEVAQEALAMADWKHNETIFDFQNNILEIKVIKQGVIKYSNQITIDGAINEIIHLNAEMLLSILKSIDDDIFILKIKDKISTIVIEANNFMDFISPLKQ